MPKYRQQNCDMEVNTLHWPQQYDSSHVREQRFPLAANLLFSINIREKMLRCGSVEIKSNKLDYSTSQNHFKGTGYRMRLLSEFHFP
jgi:hypothetical protein